MFSQETCLNVVGLLDNSRNGMMRISALGNPLGEAENERCGCHHH